MNYNLIKTNDVIEEILKINNISLAELNKEYDFSVKDEVFLNFKNKLLENKEKKFLIVGDYDADGICSTTIIKLLLNHLNIQNNFIIPSRINQGYGLNNDIVEMAKKNSFDCLLLVDNGIAANEQITLANSLGIKVFIIDHHEYDELPNAEAIIHSSIVSENYAHLSAGGLSFVLSRSVYNDDLSLVLGGLSTISDMMSVTHFNRYLIKEMMKLLKTNKIYQLNYLNDNNPFSYDALSFNVIPKINSLSRMEPMGDANKLVQYFLADENTCRITIEQINYVNEKRKQYTKQMASEADRLVKGNCIEVLASSSFMEGLCGLIANRVVQSINRPVIVLALKDGIYKGSGRGNNSFNLYEVLKDYEHYETFGGHEVAVGLSIKQENYDSFLKYLSNISIDSKENVKDALLVDEELVNFDLFNSLIKLEPFGTDFNKPNIAILNNNYKRLIISNRFPKYLIRNDLNAISFNENLKDLNPDYLIGTLKIDSYHKNSLELLIEDLI